jgi:hypothetical protein
MTYKQKPITLIEPFETLLRHIHNMHFRLKSLSKQRILMQLNMIRLQFEKAFKTLIYNEETMINISDS